MYVGTARIGIRNHSAATKTNVKLNRTVSSMFHHMCIIVNANAFLLLIVLCYAVVSRRERYIIRVDPHTGFLNMGLRMCFFLVGGFCSRWCRQILNVVYFSLIYIHKCTDQTAVRAVSVCGCLFP